MAREIDFDNLQDDDYPYLQARSFLVTEAELQGYEGIREKVDAWKPKEEDEEGEYDARQDVRPAPQVTGEADSLGETTTIPEGADGSDDSDEEEVDYSSASKAELVAEAEERGLPTSGTKDELIKRLEEDDAKEDEEEEV